MPSMKIGQPWQSDPRDLSLRPFESTGEDLQALAYVRNETLRPVTLPEDFREMDAAGIERFYNRADFSLMGNAWLLFHRDEPVAAAVVYPSAIFHNHPPGNFDIYVVPHFAHHGLGSRLLAHLEQAAAARGYPVLETTIAAEDAGSTHFLSKHGFNIVGHSFHMVRTQPDEPPPATLVEGYAIRSLADLHETTELYRDTANRLGAYDANYSLIRPEEMEQVIEQPGWDPAGVLFTLDRDGRIVGVIRASAGANGSGYLHEIRLEPDSRGQGLGTTMLAAALRHLASLGISRVELDTAGEDTAAYNLAAKAGFQVARHWLHLLKGLGVRS